MADINNIINIILSDEKLKNSGAFDSELYRDEPILRTAAQLDSYTPPIYSEMKKLAKTREAMQNSEAWLFCKQGKMMEEHEDDYAYTADFVRYYPTYQLMTFSQLRGYFSWRTKLRKGTLEPASLSFAFIYIYELINGIGAASAEDGFEKLLSFREKYLPIDRRIERHLKTWLVDYIVYYGLDRSAFERLGGINGEPDNAAYDGAVETLLDSEKRSDDELFAALCVLSSYNIEASPLYKRYPEKFSYAACEAFRELCRSYQRSHGRSYCARLFGTLIPRPYRMFDGAVFYDSKRYEDYVYEVSGIHRYVCKNGNWQCEYLFAAGGKSKELGDVIKALDSRMRRAVGFGRPIKQEKLTKNTEDIIDAAIAASIERELRAVAPKIEIDLSKLDGIRTAADSTRDKLITEEEYADACEAVNSPANDAAEEENHTDNDLPLDETETFFMRCLLYGGDYVETLRKKGLMPSVMADGINEKLFDLFADQIIDFDGDDPVIIEDYEDDLKGLIGK